MGHPSTLDVNVMHFPTPQGFNAGRQIGGDLRDILATGRATLRRAPRFNAAGRQRCRTERRGSLGLPTAHHSGLAGRLADVPADRLTDAARARFTGTTIRQVPLLRFPFIIAVRDRDEAFSPSRVRSCLPKPRERAFTEACRKVERAARHRLEDVLSC